MKRASVPSLPASTRATIRRTRLQLPAAVAQLELRTNPSRHPIPDDVSPDHEATGSIRLLPRATPRQPWISVLLRGSSDKFTSLICLAGHTRADPSTADRCGDPFSRISLRSLRSTLRYYCGQAHRAPVTSAPGIVRHCGASGALRPWRGDARLGWTCRADLGAQSGLSSRVAIRRTWRTPRQTMPTTNGIATPMTKSGSNKRPNDLSAFAASPMRPTT
jgi:hypothetical protein